MFSLNKLIKKSYLNLIVISRNKTLSNLIQARKLSLLNKYTFRSHTCNELSVKNLGENVCLAGWIKFARFNKFFVLKDKYGSVQLIINPAVLDKKLKKENLKKLNIESVVIVTGIVCKRPENQIKHDQETGEIEINVNDIKFINSSLPNLPFSNEENCKTKKGLKLKYRYLDLRSKKLQSILKFKSDFLFDIRSELIKNLNFTEVETPTLFKFTPGGAQEFIVPTRNKYEFYTLTQSPQQFKQLLMIGSTDKYFQIARCYRDEVTRSNRQPEFTQIDLELTFTTSEYVQKLIEDLLQKTWPKQLENIQTPFQKLTYKEVINKYGIDKPDLRLDLDLINLLDLKLKNRNDENYFIIIKKGMNLNKNLIDEINKTIINKLKRYINKNVNCNILDFSQNSFKNNQIIYSSDGTENDFKLSIDSVQSKTNLEAGDKVIFLSSGSQKLKNIAGQLRNEIIPIVLNDKLVSESNNLCKEKYRFLWVYDFPLFIKNSDGKIESSHHPFTAPIPEHNNLLYSNPLETIGQHFDLVLNGSEIGGGSIRIHDFNVQTYIFDKILKSDVKTINYFLEALKFGCPPHGGIALGLDRLISLMLETNSIRDVIAFPKTTNGKDLMSDCPNLIPDEVKKHFNLNTK